MPAAFLHSLSPNSSFLDRARLMEDAEADRKAVDGVDENRPIRSDYRQMSIDSEEAQLSANSDEGQTPTRGFGIEQAKNSQVPVPEGRGLKKFFAYVGPGFLVAIAYMDPGNFESDLQAGARFRYELLWVLLLATIAGTLIQSLASNLGVVTGKHLAEHCRAEYPSKANHMLWILAEIAIIASDIPEVIGTAYALNLLFQLQLWVGVILTGFSTLFFLAVQQFGVRKLEFLIFLLVFTIASCFFVELHYVKPSSKEIFHGLLVPRLRGQGAFGIAISLMGAMVMPHNLYLHSALVLTRRTPRTFQDVKDGCRYNFIETSFALLVSFVINLSVVCVSGAACHSEALSPEDQNNCKELDLNHASFLLRNVLGKWNSTLYGIALLASGQSSTITGTYAGQYVMQGFLDLRFAPWIRNMITRCVAIIPSLVVSLIGGSRGAGKLIIGSSMILSFELPFALLPLLKFTSNRFKMGAHANSAKIRGLAWLTGLFILLVNIFYLCNWCVHWIRTTTLPRPVVVILGILGSIVILAYLGFTCYLAVRTERTQTYILPDMAESIGIADERINLEVEMS